MRRTQSNALRHRKTADLGFRVWAPEDRRAKAWEHPERRGKVRRGQVRHTNAEQQLAARPPQARNLAHASSEGAPQHADARARHVLLDPRLALVVVRARQRIGAMRVRPFRLERRCSVPCKVRRPGSESARRGCKDSESCGA